jgi:hypothetical protein
MKEQFSGASTEDAAAHLNNFVELCEMQKYENVESDIIKLKLFPSTEIIILTTMPIGTILLVTIIGRILLPMVISSELHIMSIEQR